MLILTSNFKKKHFGLLSRGTFLTGKSCEPHMNLPHFSKLYLAQFIHIKKSLVNTPFTRLLPFVAEFNSKLGGFRKSFLEN